MAEDDPTRQLLERLLGEISTEQGLLFTEPAVEMLYHPLAERVRQGERLNASQIHSSLTTLVHVLRVQSDRISITGQQYRYLEEYRGRVLSRGLGFQLRGSGYVDVSEMPRAGRIPMHLIDTGEIVRGFHLAYCKIPPFCGRPTAAAFMP